MSPFVGIDVSAYATPGTAIVSFVYSLFGWETPEEKIEEARQHYVAVCWLFDYIVVPMNMGGQSALYVKNWEA